MIGSTVYQQDEEVKTMLREKWLGERVTLEGLVVCTQSNPNPKVNYLTTKIEDVTVILNNRERHHLSHTWLQKSEALKEVPEGTKIRFTATIKPYTKKDGVESVGFTLPYNCEFLSPSKSIPVKATVDSYKGNVDPNKGNVVAQFMQVLATSKAAIERLGGEDKLNVFLATVNELGGPDNLQSWLDLTYELGGVEALQQLLLFLKPTRERCNQ